MEESASDPLIAKILKVRKIVKERDEARTGGNFLKSDRLREKLASEYGVDLIDQKGGPSGWKFKDGTSNKIPVGSKLAVINDGGAPESGKKRKRENEDADKPKADGINADRKKLKASLPLKASGAKPLSATKPKTPKAVPPSAEQERNRALAAAVTGQSTAPSSSSNARVSTVRNVNGVFIEDLQPGSGAVAQRGSRVKVNYIGRLKSNNKVFDASARKPFAFTLGRGEVIAGKCIFYFVRFDNNLSRHVPLYRMGHWSCRNGHWLIAKTNYSARERVWSCRSTTKDPVECNLGI